LGPGSLNAWSQARAANPEAADLTDTNPARHGLTSPKVAECLARAAGRIACDPDPRGDRRARAALAERFGGSPKDYWLTASTSEAYAWLFQLLTAPGEAVAAPLPGYPLIEPLAALAATAVRPYWFHYLDKDGWVLDRATLDDAVQGRPGSAPAKAVVAVSPGNPTGAWAPLEEIAQAAAGLPLIVDQVFAPFALEAETPPPKSAETLAFTLDGVSKRLAAPGVKIGWIRLDGPPGAKGEAAEALDRVADSYLSVSAVAAAALPELLELEAETVAQARHRALANLEVLRRQWPGRVRRCQAGWVAVIDAPVAEADLALRLLRHHSLAVHPGWFYSIPGPKALVVSLLPAEPVFADLSGRLADALGGGRGDQHVGDADGGDQGAGLVADGDLVGGDAPPKVQRDGCADDVPAAGRGVMGGVDVEADSRSPGGLGVQIGGQRA
jgi:aspartate/methionine/tyrosine aminotransferase